MLRDFIGFSAGDVLEVAVAAFLILTAAILWPRISTHAQWLSRRTVLCGILLGLLPIALRLALLPNHPVPSPDIYDEFSHLLVADTLRHFRLANPIHPMHRFFETFFVMQQPTYSSIYPVGQGLALALGRAVFGTPWAGVLVATGALCSLCYWMLLGWTTPGWALLGGLLAVFQFGPLNLWMNSYWGGALPAAAGCLVFGALPRLVGGNGVWPAILLGVGVAVHVLTRPYESLFLMTSVLLFFVPHWRALNRSVWLAAAMVAPAIGITLLQNQLVTGSWTTLPYSLSQYQYGVPAALTFQKPPEPHFALTREQQLDYKMQRGFQGDHPETWATYSTRMEYRIRFYRFFFLPPLYFALIAFLVSMRDFRSFWIVMTLALFALGVNFFPAWQFHYIAAETCLFVLVSIIGLQRLSRVSAEMASALVCLCLAHFVFWYGVHVVDAPALLAYETWDVINHGNPERRIAIDRELARMPGKQLVFVHYGPQHIFQEEWVWNEADIDGSRVVWARDEGPDDEVLRRYYPNRAAWILDADSRPLPKLSVYVPPAPPAPAAPPPAAPEKKKTEPEGLHFEPIPQGR